MHREFRLYMKATFQIQLLMDLVFGRGLQFERPNRSGKRLYFHVISSSFSEWWRPNYPPETCKPV
jgi:hypothetical protein